MPKYTEELERIRVLLTNHLVNISERLGRVEGKVFILISLNLILLGWLGWMIRGIVK